MHIPKLTRTQKRKVKKILKKALYWVFIVGLIGLAMLVLAFLYYGRQLPAPEVLITRSVSESTKIFDRTGDVLLYDVHGTEKRTIVAFDAISQNVKDATLAAEDDEFYSHPGIDWKGIIRALYTDVRTGSAAQGGSTITQQLIKNSLFGQEKTVSRKIKEIVFAIQVERKFTKDEILWMYLNQIPYGSDVYGIEAAAEEFWDVSASEVSVAQAAMLAALPKAPTYFSPHGNNVDELTARTKGIIRRMHTLDMITEDERDQALDEYDELVVEPSTDGIKAPHFVIMVREYLVDRYGEDVVQNGGLRVITTLDMDLQELAEETVTKYGDSNETTYNAGNMALVAADPNTGELLAMVGSRDYFDIENDGNFNVATALRQPGSSFKPFAYVTAFEKGFTDSTILFDLKTEFNASCNPSGAQINASNGGKCYSPNNYSGGFAGPVTMRQALARSLNVPAVKTQYLAGINDTIRTATAMGITSLDDPARFGLALVLGGGEVQLMDMVSAYGVFANDGVLVRPAFIQQVITNDGRILEEYEKETTRVLSQQNARLMSNILSDNNARAAVFGFNSSLHISGRAVAGKTGTTQENRDGWLVGYSPNFVAGVWAGNNDNSRMSSRATGASVAGPAWKSFMTQALAQRSNRSFTPPDPVVSTKPMLNGSYRGPAGTHTILHYVDPDNPQGSAPGNPYQDPQYLNWEIAVQSWLSSFSPPADDPETSSDNEPYVTVPPTFGTGTPVPVTF